MGLLVVGILTALVLSNLVPDPAGRGIWRGGAKTPDAPWYQQLHGRIQRLGFYIGDNFGFRASLPLVRLKLREVFASPDLRPVYVGRDGQLFSTLQLAPEQSLGLLRRTAAVDRFVALMAAMDRHLAPLGSKLVVALPPNAQSVDLAFLPKWQDRFAPERTEYSMMLDALKADGIAAVDLRAVLRQAPHQRHYLANDTHWNNLSAVLAFNAVMRTAGHADWQVNVDQVVGPLIPTGIGDLGRVLRRPTPLPDENQQLNLKPDLPRIPLPGATNRHEFKGFDPFVMRYGRSGPRVLILGDSFTINSWPRLFAFTPVSEVAWMHFSSFTLGACDFSFRDLMRFEPDLVIVARTERMFVCLRNAWPDGLPPPAN